MMLAIFEFFLGGLLFAAIAGALAFRMSKKRWPTLSDVKALFTTE